MDQDLKEAVDQFNSKSRDYHLADKNVLQYHFKELDSNTLAEIWIAADHLNLKRLVACFEDYEFEESEGELEQVLG